MLRIAERVGMSVSPMVVERASGCYARHGAVGKAACVCFSLLLCVGEKVWRFCGREANGLLLLSPSLSGALDSFLFRRGVWGRREEQIRGLEQMIVAKCLTTSVCAKCSVGPRNKQADKARMDTRFSNE